MAYQSTYTGKQIDILKNLGSISLSSNTSVTYTLADTYYPITGTFSDGGLSNNFTDNGDGSITYNGEDGTFLLNGTSDFEIGGNQSAEIYYALFKDGVLIPGAETPHEFDRFNQTENISITGAVPLETGDVLQVYTRCDDAGRVLTIRTLSVTFSGN